VSNRKYNKDNLGKLIRREETIIVLGSIPELSQGLWSFPSLKPVVF
jgi:hypothetical protein